jgi:hypothetical protein
VSGSVRAFELLMLVNQSRMHVQREIDLITSRLRELEGLLKQSPAIDEQRRVENGKIPQD